MSDKLDQLDDHVAATAFRRLVRHLRHRSDAQNVDLMGLAGFCRNCLGDWIEEASDLSKAEARETVYGMPQSEWKTRFQKEATPAQLARMKESMTKNEKLDEELDAALNGTVPTPQPTTMTARDR